MLGAERLGGGWFCCLVWLGWLGVHLSWLAGLGNPTSMLEVGQLLGDFGGGLCVQSSKPRCFNAYCNMIPTQNLCIGYMFFLL